MIYPDFATYKKLAKKGNLIPVVKELILDCESPVSAFIKISKNSESAFLLESVEYGEKIGRYSFLGRDPELIVEKKGKSIFLKERAKKKQKISGNDPLIIMKKFLQRCKLVPVKGVPMFSGGFVGFVSYENVAIFENIKLKTLPSLNFPDAVFFLMKNLVVFDHLDKKVKIIILSNVKKNIRRSYEGALREIDTTEKLLARQGVVEHRRRKSKATMRIKSNMSKKKFENSVKKIREYIKAGDVIQVVFSQRFSLGKIDNDFNIYRALRTINPSPYMFYFKYKSMQLIGSSPEVLVKKEGDKAEVRPIAGTRKRGSTDREDAALARDLKCDKKELAEHLMLVDLGRNDIGRVCNYNSVEVKDYARIEKYSHVMHLVSEVHGKLNKGKDAFDLLRATFPAGTVTGAPKIRAMEIVNELEPSERGPYAGCLGYFSFSGDCDTCITIRTIMIKNQEAYLQAGAGIVYDSIPSREYHETINKAKALINAFKVAEAELS